jgi:hypothetical protein
VDRCPAGNALHIYTAKPLDAAARHHFSHMIEANPISRLLLVAIYWAFHPRAGYRKKALAYTAAARVDGCQCARKNSLSSVMFFCLRLAEGIRPESEIRTPSRE